MRSLFTRLAPHLAFLGLVLISVVLAWKVDGRIFPTAGLPSVWFYSGLVLLLFGMFYVEPHYGAPRNAMTHALAVILVLLAVREDLQAIPAASPWYQSLLTYASVVLVVSWTAANIGEPEDGPDHWANRAAGALKDVSVLFGEARVLYSGVFLLFLPLFHDVGDPAVLAALTFWWLVVMTNPQKRVSAALADVRSHRDQIAEITGVQSRRVFLAKAYPTGPVIRPLDPVEFTYAVDQDATPLKKGIVLTSHFLNDEKWIRVLELESGPPDGKRKANAIYRTDHPKTGRTHDLVNRFLGVVVERSEIGTIQFELIPGGPRILEGDLVEVPIGDDRVFYQVVNAHTGKELLEAKNESGFIRVDAVQLGCWDPGGGSFSRYGWLPDMTDPVLKAEPSGGVLAPQYPEYHLGVLPGTRVPFLIDLDAARSHHVALLGITGAGKSFIAFEMIRHMLADTKVICVDFTDEYMEKLADLNPKALIDVEGLEVVEQRMAEKADAAQRRDGKAEALELRKKIEKKLEEYVEAFIEGEGNLAVFELPDLSNTTFILEFTQMFLEAVFVYAKTHRGQRICLVLEEAHTVVPETSSLGDFGDYSSNKALVNKIGQIALQGRKYGVGFLVIAQRTANVSKTVLTQCNSIICFQAFDETSYRFLENHLGSKMVTALPRLRPYHAIAVGKAFRGNVPMIVDLTRPLPEFSDVRAPSPADPGVAAAAIPDGS